MPLGLNLRLSISGNTVTGEVIPDTTAPVIVTSTYSDPDLTLDITEASGAGTLVWATSDTTESPTFTVAGGWVGTTYETGSYAVTSGSNTDTITLTSSTPAGSRKLTFYVYDAADNLSLVDSETITVASSFTPADLFGVGDEGVWYDVHPDYCYTDASKTTNATVGDAVYVLEDRSGNGYDATQATFAARPILRQDVSSNYYLEFDGTDDYLTLGQQAWFDQHIGTTIAGFQSNTTNGTLIGNRSASLGTSGKGIFFRSGPIVGLYHVGGGGGQATASIATGTVYVGAFEGDGANVKAALDGAAYTTVTSGYTPQIEPKSDLMIGDDGRVGGNPADCHVYQLVAINRVITVSERSDTETFVADKSGVTL